MKKIYLILFIFINLIFISSCKFLNDYETYRHQIWSMNTIIEVYFYDEKDHEKYYTDMKEIFIDIASKTSDYTGGIVYTLNEERKVTYDDTLLNILQYAEECRILTEGYFNPYMGKLRNKVLETSTITQNDIKIERKKLKAKGLVKDDIIVLFGKKAHEIDKRYGYFQYYRESRCRESFGLFQHQRRLRRQYDAFRRQYNLRRQAERKP